MERSGQTPLWRRRLRKFFANPWVEICIGVLILLSVSLTLLEFWFEHRLRPESTGGGVLDSIFRPVTESKLSTIEYLGDAITAVFVVELLFRYFAFGNLRRFLAEHWLDVLATIPLFRVLLGFLWVAKARISRAILKELQFSRKKAAVG